MCAPRWNFIKSGRNGWRGLSEKRLKTVSTKAALLVLVAQAMFFSNQILAANSTVITGGMTNAAPVFQVTAMPEKSRVHVKEVLMVDLEVENISHTNQSFTTMLCSWQENWASDNRQIGIWPGLECIANRPITVNLASGESWKKRIKDVDSRKCSNQSSFLPNGFHAVTVCSSSAVL